MRFTTAIVAGAFAAFASAQSSTVSVDPAIASQAACIEDCPLGDVKCQSYCISVPSPNEDQVNETTKCAAKCDQGDGSPSDTEKYAACQKACTEKYYWKSVDGTPRETGSGSGSSDDEEAAETSVTRASVTTTVSDATVTNTVASKSRASESADEAESTADSTDASETSGTATGTAAQSTETDSGASAIVGGVSFVGLVAAVLAL